MAREEEVQGRKAKGRKETPKAHKTAKRSVRKPTAESTALADAIMGVHTPVGQFTMLYPKATIGDMTRFILANKEQWEAFYGNV